MNVKRTTARSRLHLVTVVRPLIAAALEDHHISPSEEAQILDALEAQVAYAAVIDIRDGLDRVSSPERLDPLLAEYRAWTDRLPAA